MGLFRWLFGKRRDPPPEEPPGQVSGAGSGDLEGAWNVVSWEMDGQAVEVASRYDKVVIEHDKYVAVRGDEAVGLFFLKLDGSKQPKQVNLLFPQENEPFLGIFAREGDTLKLCWDGTRPGRRPTAFTGASPCMCLGLLRSEAYAAEAARLQGKWSVLEMEENGAKVPEGRCLTAIEFAADALILTRSDQARLVMAFSINPLTNPKSVEIVAEPGDGRQFFMTGIYALEEDRLRLCWHDSGHGRPAGFETSASTSASSFLLKRAEVPVN